MSKKNPPYSSAYCRIFIHTQTHICNRQRVLIFNACIKPLSIRPAAYYSIQNIPFEPVVFCRLEIHARALHTKQFIMTFCWLYLLACLLACRALQVFKKIGTARATIWNMNQNKMKCVISSICLEDSRSIFFLGRDVKNGVLHTVGSCVWHKCLTDTPWV